MMEDSRQSELPPTSGNIPNPDIRDESAPDYFANAHEEAARLNQKFAEAASEMVELGKTVERCVGDARTLAETGAPYSAEITEQVEEISIAVRAVAEQFRKVSIATIAISSQSAARMAEDLRKSVREMVLESGKNK